MRNVRSPPYRRSNGEGSLFVTLRRHPAVYGELENLDAEIIGIVKKNPPCTS